MSVDPDRPRCRHAEDVCAFAAGLLSDSEARAVEAHLASCTACGEEFAATRQVVDAFDVSGREVLRPAPSLQARLAHRIAGEHALDAAVPAREWTEPEWKQVAPGIECRFLASDTEHHRVSMLVRLAPGADYPPHTHAGVEELHLLDGELWIEERKLYPGDYNRAEPGTGDKRVWSETGCTCVLVTSTQDTLG